MIGVEGSQGNDSEALAMMWRRTAVGLVKWESVSRHTVTLVYVLPLCIHRRLGSTQAGISTVSLPHSASAEACSSVMFLRPCWAPALRSTCDRLLVLTLHVRDRNSKRGLTHSTILANV